MTFGCRIVLTESVKSFDGRPQVGLSYGLVLRVDANGEVIDTFEGNSGRTEGRIATDIYTRRIQLPCPTMTFRGALSMRWDCLTRRCGLRKTGDMWLRIALKYEVALVPKVIARYRIRAGIDVGPISTGWSWRRRGLLKSTMAHPAAEAVRVALLSHGSTGTKRRRWRLGDNTRLR